MENQRNFGTVIGSLTFEYNTMHDDDYSLYFVNIWDQSSPSYHNKTVEVVIREIAPSVFNISHEVLAVLLPIVGGLGASLLVAIVIMLRRRRGSGGVTP